MEREEEREGGKMKGIRKKFLDRDRHVLKL